MATTMTSEAKAATKPAQRLFIPGPTDVLPAVMAAMTAPMIGHRSDEFEALYGKVQEQLRALFLRRQRVYVAAGHRVLRGTRPRFATRCGGTALNFVNGAFGLRWHEAAKGCDKEAIHVDVPWNMAVRTGVRRGKSAPGIGGRSRGRDHRGPQRDEHWRHQSGRRDCGRGCVRSARRRWCWWMRCRRLPGSQSRSTRGGSTCVLRRRKRRWRCPRGCRLPRCMTACWRGRSRSRATAGISMC